MQSFVYALHFIACFVLVAVVLLQRGKGADLGASLGGGGANTLFGSRGAGNFLTKLTTASAVVFMGTSLTLSYMGYQASDVRLFDEDTPLDVPIEGAAPGEEAGGLQEIPIEGDTGGLQEIPVDGDAAGGLQEIPAAEDGAATAASAAGAGSAAGAEAEQATGSAGAPETP